jgi:Uma2 family endonuclease
VLAGEHVELIGGQIVEMAPEGTEHSALTVVVAHTLAAIVPSSVGHVRSDHPLALGEWNAPEPDAVIVTGQPRDYLRIDSYPTAEQTLLVVEVSYSSRAYDLGTKADIYAAARIADYWVVVPAERVVIVCRQPTPAPDSETDWRYAERRTYIPGQTITPVAPSLRPVAVADLLPRPRGVAYSRTRVLVPLATGA